jgi:hypothetical protein
VFSLKRLPLSQDRRPSLLEGLMGARQHPGEGNQRRFWLDAGSESPPKNHLRLLRSGRRVGADAPPTSASIVATGVAGAPTVAAEGVLDGIAVAGAVAAVGVVGTPSAAAAPLGVGAAVAGSIAGAWGPSGTVSAVAAGGGEARLWT